MKIAITEKIRKLSFAQKSLICMLVFFCVCCIKVCAENAPMSAAQAEVYRENFVQEAKKYVGSPYVYGAVGPDSFDCSGLIYYCAREACGIQLPRTAKAIYSYCKIVPDKDREIGDLLFFKTNSTATITHVGIYIGNSKFISAISDGENTGVIISSLNQTYWKGKYIACGQFIKSGKGSATYIEDEITDEETENVAKSGKNGKTSTYKGIKVRTIESDNILEDLKNSVSLESDVFANWTFFTPNNIMLNFRGVDISAEAVTSLLPLNPGIGVIFRINTCENIFQMPVIISGRVNEIMKFYAGPVFSFGKAHMIKNENQQIYPSIFPGIIGVSFATPAFDFNDVKVQIVQDLNYSVFNSSDNAALPFLESLSAGINLSTGVKVSLPLSKLF